MRECAEDECNRPVACRGLCEKHYRRLLRGVTDKQERHDRDYVIGEIEWFLECGVSPDLTMVAVGYTLRDSLMRSLKRWGRPDLAEHFTERQEESWFNQWLEGKHRAA